MRRFVEIRERRLILLLELASDAEGKNIRQKKWERFPKWEPVSRLYVAGPVV